MDDFAECLRLHQSGKTADSIGNLVNILATHPDDPDARFLLALIGSGASLADPANGLFDDLLLPDHQTAGGYERVGHGLRGAGLEKLAQLAFKAAAAKEKETPSWGDKPFNGQEKRADLFRSLVKLVDVGAIVETGTFRGSTTQFFHECTGLHVYSCELSDRYFVYASERLAAFDRIHLYKGDSRNFLSQLGEDAHLENKIVFFYLDAHWNADLPLVRELQLILQNFKSPIIMIDDFEVPHRDDYGFDDYGEKAILSLDILEPVLTVDMSLFYPAWPPVQDSNPQRGFVILAKGELARRIGTLTEYLREFDRFGAALEQMQRYRRMLRQGAADLETAKSELQRAETEHRQTKSELQESNLAGQVAAEHVAELKRRVDAVEQSRVWRGTQRLKKWLDGASGLWRQG